MAKRKDPRKTPGETTLGEATPPGATPNPGLPDPKSVVSERIIISPKGRRYRILRTTDKDPYDPPDDQDQDNKHQGKKDRDKKSK